MLFKDVLFKPRRADLVWAIKYPGMSMKTLMLPCVSHLIRSLHQQELKYLCFVVKISTCLRFLGPPALLPQPYHQDQVKNKTAHLIALDAEVQASRVFKTCG